MKRFVPITRKVNLLIIISLIIGIGSITYFFTDSIASTIDTMTKENLLQQSEILHTSIENFMMPGQAPLVMDFFDDMQEINPDYRINLYRTDGTEAFVDTKTMDGVNAFLGRDVFSADRRKDPTGMAPVEDQFEIAVGRPPGEALFVTEDDDDRVFYRVYAPLINLPKCTRCHGSDHTIRGVVDVQNDISESTRARFNSLVTAAALFLGMVLILAIILSQYIRGAVIRPVRVIGEACAGVTEGNFDASVSLESNDEIGRLGRTVNEMIRGLYERFKLSKYVSSSTIASLDTEKDGLAAYVTLLFSDIRGFTSYTEQNTPDEVVSRLNDILNIQSEIILRHNGDIDKYVGDEIVAMFSGQTPEISACRAAVEIQQELTADRGSYSGLRVGIGINTGDVILGMIGSEQRADFTVIGDNVNSASRLCDAAQKGEILISANTYKAIKDEVTVDGPFRLKVKGKDEYMVVYLLEGITRETEEEQTEEPTEEQAESPVETGPAEEAIEEVEELESVDATESVEEVEEIQEAEEIEELEEVVEAESLDQPEEPEELEELDTVEEVEEVEEIESAKPAETVPVETEEKNDTDVAEEDEFGELEELEELEEADE